MTGYQGQAIVPLSEIQEVVTRKMVEENKEKQQRKHRIAEVEHKIRLSKACCFCPVVLIFVGLCIYFVVATIITANFPNTVTDRNVPSFCAQSKLILASNLSSVFPCKALSIWTDMKVLADFFLFASRENLKYDKRETSHNKVQLRTDKYWSKSFVIRKGMYLSSNFCLISNSSAAIRLYISKGIYDLNYFTSLWPHTDMGSREYTEYRATNKACYSFTLFPDILDAKKFIVFANKGGPLVFVNASFVLHSTAFMTSNAVHTCRNTSYCRIPHSIAAKFVVMTFNTTEPEDLANDLANRLECIVEKLYAYLLWGGLFVANIILFTVTCVCARRKIFPQFNKCFKEQFDSIDREVLLAQQSESDTQLLQA